MRKTYGGILHLAAVIEDDLDGRDTGLSKPQRIGLADITTSVLTCRSINTSELASILPRKVKSDENRYRYINRWLANDKIKPLRVMMGFIPELLESLYDHNKTAVLMMDQSKISEEFECLMVSMRIGDRALPVGWRVIKTKESIGFDIQKPLLEEVHKGMQVLLLADRFYGTSALISFCQNFHWQYRIRLKGNLILKHQGGEITTKELIKNNLHFLENATLSESGVTTCVGALQEEGHKEPWIIAMECKPTKGRILDYGMLWGIEALFSDLKTRGF
ncbi:MAG: hypothetical protein K940chlam8_01212 [Chlamydiae bacterium]|nr:hypothetical protein [Chlamydiota bacterium]